MGLLSYARALAAVMRGLADQPTLIHTASAGFDRTLVGVGGSPFGAPVDPTSGFLDVPAAPSTPGNRYLHRACTFSIPAGKVARIIAVGEYTEIGAFLASGSGGGGAWVRQPVLSPGWAFPDGNTARGITTRRTQMERTVFIDPGQLPSTDPNLFNISPGLIYVPAPTTGGPVPYVAPSGGRFPGSPLEGLGLWRDKRFQWSLASSPLDYAVPGGQDLFYWISTKQTDPATRPVIVLPDAAAVDALTPEDRFLYRFPELARYTRVGGYMVLEMGPSSTSDRSQNSPDIEALTAKLREVFK